MGKFSRLGNDLYTGRRSIDFVGRKWLWYAISGVIVAAGRRRALVQGPELRHRVHRRHPVPASRCPRARSPRTPPTSCARRSPAPASTRAASPDRHHLRAATRSSCRPSRSPTAESAKVVDAIVQDDRRRPAADHLPGPRSARAGARRSPSASLIGLVVFLVLVVLFIWAYFREWKMSVAAIVALAHDMLITIGVYALSGFEVHPGDGHRPAHHPRLLALRHRRGLRQGPREHQATCASAARRTPRAANLAVNQTLVRSINTSIVALIPVGAILYVSAVQLGASSLKDLALALFVGMAAGVYSSIFIATPLLVQLKSSETEVRLAEKRAKAARRHEADRYASVPAFTEDMPIQAEPAPATGRDLDGRRRRRRAGRRPAGAPRPPEAAGRGRIAPPARGPVRPSGAVGSPAADPADHVQAGQEVTRTATDAPRPRRAALGRWSSTSPTSPSPGSSSRTSPRCWPTTTAFTAVVAALAAAGRDADGSVGRRQGARHGGARLHPRAPRSRWRSASASCRSARPASCRARRTPSPTRWSTARRRSSCTATRSRPATGCCSSTTCWPPAAPLAATRELVEQCGGTVHGGRGADGARLPPRPRGRRRPPAHHAC